MDSQYSESLVGDDYSENSMQTHAEDDSSITTEDRDENSSEEEQSSIPTEVIHVDIAQFLLKNR